MSLWGSLFIQSTVANTVFVLLFLAIQLVAMSVKKIRLFSAISLGSTTFVVFAVLLLSIKALLSGHASEVFGLLDHMLVLAVVPTVFVLFLQWNTTSPRKVCPSDSEKTHD